MSNNLLDSRLNLHVMEAKRLAHQDEITRLQTLIITIYQDLQGISKAFAVTLSKWDSYQNQLMRQQHVTSVEELDSKTYMAYVNASRREFAFLNHCQEKSMRALMTAIRRLFKTTQSILNIEDDLTRIRRIWL